jgi:methionyl-tRNA formyltransferase
VPAEEEEEAIAEGDEMKTILFLGSKTEHTDKALSFLASHAQVESYLESSWGKPIPEAAGWWRGDYIISYNSRWVIPSWLLQRGFIAGINFHPGPPEYPGTGCLNWALYDGVTEYGVTCHHMAPQVDSGQIIKAMRFPVFATDTVESLLERTHTYQSILFLDVMWEIFSGKPIPSSDEVWSGKARTRKELDDLLRIDPAMSSEEVERRMKATTYKKWQPFIELHGRRWVAK